MSPSAEDGTAQLLDALLAAAADAQLLVPDAPFRSERRDGYLVSEHDATDDVLSNGVLVFGRRSPQGAELAAVREDLATRGRRFGLTVVEGWTAGIDRAIEELGLNEQTDEVGLGMRLERPDLIATDLDDPAAIRRVETHEEMDAAIDLLTDVFGVPRAVFEPFHTTLEAPLRERFAAALVDDPDGRTVSTAAAFVSAGGAQVMNVATLERARGRGYATAATAAVAAAGLDMGASFAWLIATPDGVGPYRRLGFRGVCTFRLYA